MSDASVTSGFRPAARRRHRIAAGVALGAAAIGGNVLVYSSLDDSQPVVQVVRDVPAGQQITADMLRTVDVDLDGSVAAIPGEQLDLLPGRYAKVRVVSGSLLVAAALQHEPLVTEGSSIVALRIPDGMLPTGLRERSRLQLVLPATDDETGEPMTVDARAIALPTSSGSALGDQSLSVEVDEHLAARVAAADEVRIVLLPPSADLAATRTEEASD